MVAKKKPKRNYAKEAKWAATKEQKLRRAERNRARAKAIKKYGKAALKGKEVHHVNGRRRGKLGGKTAVVSRAYNRRKQPKRGKK